VRGLDDAPAGRLDQLLRDDRVALVVECEGGLAARARIAPEHRERRRRNRCVDAPELKLPN